MASMCGGRTSLSCILDASKAVLRGRDPVLISPNAVTRVVNEADKYGGISLYNRLAGWYCTRKVYESDRSDTSRLSASKTMVQVNSKTELYIIDEWIKPQMRLLSFVDIYRPNV